MRTGLQTLVFLAWPALAGAAPPDLDLRLTSGIVATTALGGDVSETDLDLDTRLRFGFSGLLRPELSGLLSVRDRRDLNEPPQGSALRDSWDERDAIDRERLELAWLEFGDRLALRLGRQSEWVGAPVRYDGASVRFRRLGSLVELTGFAGRRAALDDLHREDFDPVAGGRLEMALGQSGLQITSLYRDRHLLEIDFSRRLGRRGVFEDFRLDVGYSQLDLRSRDARAGAEVALRRVPLRITVRADARLSDSEDEFEFDYLTVASTRETRTMRLHLEPLPPSVLLEANAYVHPTAATGIAVGYSRRQLFDPDDTTALSFSHDRAWIRGDLLDEISGVYGSLQGSLWLPDLGEPPDDAAVDDTRGQGEVRSVRVEATIGMRRRKLGHAEVAAAWRRFDYVSSRVNVDGVTAFSGTVRLVWSRWEVLEVALWAAYDQAMPILDQGLKGVVATGLQVELRTP